MNDTGSTALRMRPVSLLGESARGEVFVGMDEVLRRRVVIKKLHARSFESDAARAVLIEEAQMLAQLDHPNILRIHGYSEADGFDVFMLEFAAGTTLAEAMSERMDFAKKLRIATAVASALVVAHRNGVVHGALSPDAVLITDSGEIKLTDFASTTTRIDGVRGDAKWQSPERAQGDNRPTRTSDMYSFGLLVRELFGERDRDVRLLISSLVRKVPSERATAAVALGRLQRLGSRKGRRIRAAAIALVVAFVVIGSIKYTIDLERERRIAIAAQADAESRRAQANDLVGFMIDDIRPKLWSAGRLDILDAATEKSLDYFAAMNPAEISPHEGSVNVTALVHLAETQLWRADLPSARKTIQQAIRMSDGALRRYPDDLDVRFASGIAHAMLTLQHDTEGDTRAAIVQARADTETFDDLVRRRPKDINFLRQKAIAYSALGTYHERVEDIGSALNDYQTAIAVKRQMLALENTNEHRVDVAITVQKAGLALLKLGRFAEARSVLTTERAAVEQMATKESTNWRLRQLLAFYDDHLANVAFATGDLDAALRHSASHLATSEALAAFDPDNVNWKEQLALAHLQSGTTARMSGNAAAALKHHQMAADVLAGMFAQGKQTARLVRSTGVIRVELARSLLANGRAREAMTQTDLTLAMLRPVPTETRGVADALLVRGEALAAQGNNAGATAAWEEGLRVVEPFDRISPDPRIRDTHARILLRLGRRDEAIPLIEELTALGYRNREFEALCKEKGADH